MTTGANVWRAFGRAPRRRRPPAGWTGADRFLRVLYERVVRHLFTPAGKAATTVVGLGGFAAFVATTATHEFTLASEALGLAVLWLFVLDAASVFVHETGHAMVLLHHG